MVRLVISSGDLRTYPFKREHSIQPQDLKQLRSVSSRDFEWNFAIMRIVRRQLPHYNETYVIVRFK